MDFTFELTEADANLVLEALGAMPLNKSMGVFFKLREQAQQQVQAQQGQSPSPAGTSADVPGPIRPPSSGRGKRHAKGNGQAREVAPPSDGPPENA